MKIAIIAPSPVPFTVGGAEKLWWGLLREINRNTTDQAELIKLPAREHSFWDLVESYENFFRLDLSHFDLVISTKYPSWMVSHPNHVCYMVHCLRGFYDCFHYLNLPEVYRTSHAQIRALQAILHQGRPNRESLEEVFDRLHQLRRLPDVPTDAFHFPGSLIKELVHYFDSVGLQTGAVRSFCAISKTVAQRAAYFPKHASVKVIYPPSNLESFHCDEPQYLFTASRLDSPKRIHLLIEAMRFVESDRQLRIAGEGPDAERLRKLAAGDPRIMFLGYRSDTELIDDYAGALAVLFVPQDEDYGLITIEAMMSCKPVITVADAGGPTEFVQHQKTGLCVEPEARQIGEAIEWLCQHPEEAMVIGNAGRASVEKINWTETVRAVLAGPAVPVGPGKNGQGKSSKLSVATTFPIVPVRGGGQSRIFHFYKNLAPRFTTEIVSLANEGEPKWSGEITPGVREIRIPKSKAHEEAERDIAAQVEWYPVTDVAFPELAHLTPDYLDALERSCRDAESIVASHPYTLSALERVSDKPLWYEAHNVEHALKKSVIPKTSRGLELVVEVERIERRACERAALVLACSESDGRELTRLYAISSDKVRLVPNGVDTQAIQFTSRQKSAELRKSLAIQSQFSALFIGSWHRPNLEAIEAIMNLAQACPKIDFLILGSSCAAFENRSRSRNIGLFGEVDDETKNLVLSVARVALNPMRQGSGTNLKMLEYAAAGVPIITTSTGARGLGFINEAEVFIAELAEIQQTLERVREASNARLEAMTTRSRQRAEKEFDWRNIAERFIAAL